MPRSLTDAQVLRIRKQAAKGGSYQQLAERYDVHGSFIAAIARGSSYADVGGPITHRKPRRRKGKRRAKRQATAAASNGRLQAPDLAALSIDDAARFLQALAMEWPKIKESFELLDRIITGRSDG